MRIKELIDKLNLLSDEIKETAEVVFYDGEFNQYNPIESIISKILYVNYESYDNYIIQDEKKLSKDELGIEINALILSTDVEEWKEMIMKTEKEHCFLWFHDWEKWIPYNQKMINVGDYH